MGSMTDLTRFLLARIDEDEAAARAVKPLEVIYPMGGKAHPQRFTHGRLSFAGEDGYPRDLTDRDASTHFARWGPARVLAECQAKRRLIKWARQWPMRPSQPSDEDQILRMLALAYADHSEYQDAWRL